jgi:hypothetical protein
MPDEESKPIDLFGFGKDPQVFEDRGSCNCGALEPGGSGLHVIDCTYYSRKKSTRQNPDKCHYCGEQMPEGLIYERHLQVCTAALTAGVPLPGTASLDVQKARREVDQIIKANLRAAGVARPTVSADPPPSKPLVPKSPAAQRAIQSMRARRMSHKTFRVTRYIPSTGRHQEMKPWDQSNTEVLQAELVLAYRIIALLVDNATGHGVSLTAEDVRRMKGQEPMFLELVMSFSKNPDGSDKVGLATQMLTPVNSDDDQDGSNP